MMLALHHYSAACLAGALILCCHFQVFWSSSDPITPTTIIANSMLRVMSYNIWGGGLNQNKSVDDNVAVIRAANADIVGMQETRIEEDMPGVGESVTAAIADALGFYYYEQTVQNFDISSHAIWDNAIISRYPIVSSTKNNIGVGIDASEVGIPRVYAFNVHLPDFPYQPYQLLNITYGDAPFITTEEEAIEYANQARGSAMDKFYSDLQEVDADEHDVVLIFGYFNEPSYLDWTEDAAKAGTHPLKDEFPTSKKLAEAGFVDALRQVYPDVVAKPAFSWPWAEVDDPTLGSEYHNDRIDFVYVRGGTGVLNVLDASIVGGNAPGVDLIYDPYPSDHKAVVAGLAWDMKSEETSSSTAGGTTESPSKEIPSSASMTKYYSIFAASAFAVLHS